MDIKKRLGLSGRLQASSTNLRRVCYQYLQHDLYFLPGEALELINWWARKAPRSGQETALDGIYSMTFRGAVDWGMGLLIFRKGVVTGVDVGGVRYDGTYRLRGDMIDFDVKMTVPPGATLVQGTPARPQSYEVPIVIAIHASAFFNGTTVPLQLPPGPVNVIFRKLREITD